MPAKMLKELVLEDLSLVMKLFVVLVILFLAVTIIFQFSGYVLLKSIAKRYNVNVTTLLTDLNKSKESRALFQESEYILMINVVIEGIAVGISLEIIHRILLVIKRLKVIFNYTDEEA